MAISKLFIANRGEIAVRINRAARDLGIRTVQAYSAADAEMLAVRMADEAVEIGPALAARSYLSAEALVAAAIRTGADAVHPGYGFLAENAAFADRVEAAGLAFVGPSGGTIRLMGNKAAARLHAQSAGVPTLPGSGGVLADKRRAAEIADEVGFPVMIKAAAGGGGRGIRVARTAGEFERLAHQASAEATSAFGDGGIYVEKFLERARHVEVQVLGDGVDVIHCWERECSLQRRHQKIWEEAPSDALSSETRAELCDSAARLARTLGYRGAGTVEYLYDESTGRFHFIEMNTRIQVEHPLTEMITGIDLVAEMIRISGGGRLRHAQPNIPLIGHAIEVRLNAEDPANDFLPFPGTVDALVEPGGPGIRFDHMLYEGYTVPPFYDSLLGKLIAWGEDRKAALARLARALHELQLQGLPSTAPLFRALVRCREVKRNEVHTGWLETWLKANPDQIATHGTGGDAP